MKRDPYTRARETLRRWWRGFGDDVRMLWELYVFNRAARRRERVTDFTMPDELLARCRAFEDPRARVLPFVKADRAR